MLYLIICLKLFSIIFTETKYILSYDVEISSDIDSIINWRYKSDYYYPNLNGKINQIFDKKCREKHLIILDDNIIQVPNSSDQILISSFKPSDDIVKYWKDIVKPSQMRQEPLLCDSPKTRRRPIFDAQGCQLPQYMHVGAPRCQPKYLKWLCDHSRIDSANSSSNGFVLPESDHKNTFIPPTPFLIVARESLVTMCGQILHKCGLIHLGASCLAAFQYTQARAIERKCDTKNKLSKSTNYKNGFECSVGTPYGNQVTYTKRLFVASEVDDTHIYHIHTEIMPRIIYHLDYLLANPDIKILVGCDTRNKKDTTTAGLAFGLLTLEPLLTSVGIPMDRVIYHTHVFADEIYLPMEGGCQDPVYNTWHLLHMRNYYLSKYPEQPHPKENTIKKMVLIKRSSGAKHTRNSHDLVRQWTDEFANSILQALMSKFQNYQISIFSDKNTTMMTCHSCQVEFMKDVNVLIGVHGAGLANMLYMKPNSAVIEIGPYSNDGRILLGGGPFNRLAAVISHNYMVHHPAHREYKWIKRTASSELNITFLVNHIHSFLKSIKKL